MTVTSTTSREFELGTTGWTVDDLNDPEIERQWEQGAYELVEGVLTKMPPAYHDGTLALAKLRRTIERFLDDKKLPGLFTSEDDLVISRMRVVRVDMMFVTPDDHRRQESANKRRGNKALKFGRFVVPPTLIVESVSPGHELHDQETKRNWYAEAGVPNYWLLNAYAKTLECLTLSDENYARDQFGKGNDEISPSLFPGLVIKLKSLWE